MIFGPGILGPGPAGSGGPPTPAAIRTAVTSSTAPNMYSTQSKRFSAAAPAAMNTPRSSRARPIPASSTRLRIRAATPDRPISRTNTNRLSSERLYSVSQPA